VGIPIRGLHLGIIFEFFWKKYVARGVNKDERNNIESWGKQHNEKIKTKYPKG
jgi:hypothetical protein